MVKFDPRTKILKLQELATDNFELNSPIADIKEAYRRYLYGSGPNTLEENIGYFYEKAAEEMNIRFDESELSVMRDDQFEKEGEFYIGRRHDVRITTQFRGNDNVSYLFRMPFQDSRGVFNVDGKLKVLLNYLVASEDVSYASGRIGVQLGCRNISFGAMSTKTKVKCGRIDKVPIDKLAMAAMFQEGISNEDSHAALSAIANYALKSRLTVNRYNTNRNYAIESSDLAFLWTNKNFMITPESRTNINYALSLDRALGQILYDDVVSPKTGVVLRKAGEEVRAEDIKRFKRHLVTVVYIESIPNLVGKKIAKPLCLNEFHKGFVVPDAYCDRFNLEVGTNVLQYDIAGDYYRRFSEEELDENIVTITLDEGHVITEDDIELIRNYGIKNLTGEVWVGSKTNATLIDGRIEILTNGTHLGEDIGAALPNDWYVIKDGKPVLQSSCTDPCVVYNVNNDTANYINDGSRLTGADLLAFFSLLGWYLAFPDDNVLYNKDTALLKRLQLADVAFSQAFHETVDNWVTNNRFATMVSNMDRENLSIRLSNIPESTFGSFRESWFEHMNDKKLFKALEQINPVAVLADVANVSTFVGNKHGISDDQRLLSLPFYGRICPYETPSSNKIGLANHKALGCIVENGVMKTQYYKATNGIVDCSKEPVKLSAKEANRHILTFPDRSNVCDEEFDASGKLVRYRIRGHMLAICPDGADVTTREVDASEIEYVFVSSIQQISTTAALVPFLCSDDPARISFALSMAKQAVFCQDNQIPRVMTGMYRKLLEYMPYYAVIAQRDGIVEAIDEKTIKVVYDPEPGAGATLSSPREKRYPYTADDREHTELRAIDETNFSGVCHFKKGALIYPHKDIHAEFDCDIIKVVDDDNGYFIVRETQPEPEKERVSIRWTDISISGMAVNFTTTYVTAGQRFKAGDMLACASIFKNGIYAPARNALVVYIPTSYNYEDAVEISEDCSKSYTSISVREEDFVASSDFAYYTPECNTTYVRPDVQAGVCRGPSHSSKATAIQPLISRHSHGYPYDIKRSGDRHSRDFSIRLLDFSTENQGDKMAGRHGNKGVNAHVCPNSEMPMFANGKIADIALNPCGVPSRMNIGQNLEAHLGFIAELLDVYIEVDAFNGCSLEMIRDLMQLVWDLANSNVDSWKSKLSDRRYDFLGSKTKVDLLTHITSDDEHINRIKEWAGAFDPDGTAKVYDPKSQRWYQNQIAFGYSYFLKLEQEVEEKVHSRAGLLDSDYVKNTRQPTHGRANGGGQASGEMELVTYAAYGAVETVHEIMNAKSDNDGLRFISEMQALGLAPNDVRAAMKALGVNPADCTPRANDILRYWLEALGVYTEIIEDEDDEFASTAQCDIYGRSDYGARCVRNAIGAPNSAKTTTTTEDICNVLGIPSSGGEESN